MPPPLSAPNPAPSHPCSLGNAATSPRAPHPRTPHPPTHPTQLPDPASDIQWYRQKAATLHNAIQPEDSFKWPTYEPARGVHYGMFDYVLDTYSNFALVRHHRQQWGCAGCAGPCCCAITRRRPVPHPPVHALRRRLYQ